VELVNSESLGVVPANTWVMSTFMPTGPGVFVFVISAGIADIYTLSVQIQQDPGSSTFVVLEDVAIPPGDRTGASALAGYQSVPVPLIDAEWRVRVRAKHDDPATVGIIVKVIKL